MIKDASGGPTGYIFRAKARGFNALRKETWEKGQHRLSRCCPHVSVTNHGAQVASQHCLILQAGSKMVLWCYGVARELWHRNIQGSRKGGDLDVCYITKQECAVST